MNNLKEVEILSVYEPNDNIQGFYNDVLSVAKEYKRVSAYFDSKLFIYISKGILGLLCNNGKMKLILSTEVKENVFNEIKFGYIERAKLEFKEIFDFKNIDKEDCRLHNLAFLIGIGRLDVKIAFKQKGILHDKYGIIEDLNGNKIIFSGSNNETEAALEINHESFETTLSWDNSIYSQEKIKKREQSFERLWNNEDPDLLVLSASDLVEDSIMKRIENIEIPKLLPIRLLYIDILDNDVIIKSNFKVQEILRSYEFRKISKYIHFTENRIQFTIPKFIEDLVFILRIFKENKNVFDYKFFESRKLSDYVEQRYIDFENLKQIGNRIKNQNIYKDFEFLEFSEKINSNVKRKLRNAQLMSAYHITRMKKVLNFSVPGSGKTASVLGAFEYLRYIGEVDKIIVIGPLNCFRAWKSEYIEVIKNSSEYDVLDLRDTGSYNNKLFALNYDYDKSKIILMNFESINSIQFKLKDYINSKAMIVFDEIHRIKNPDGIMYKACRNIVENSKYIIALTGTPLPNGYVDLHNLFEILYRSYSKTYFKFTIDNLNNLTENFKESGLENNYINELIYPFYTRISKKDLMIPATNLDRIIEVEANYDENILYNKIANDNQLSSIMKLTSLMKNSCIPEYINNKFDNQNEVFGIEENSVLNGFEEKYIVTSKIAYCIKLIKQLLSEDKSVIIWATFVRTIDKLSYLLEQESIFNSKIHGSVPTNEREIILDTFNSGKLKVLITNPSTLAESVSLHKQCHDAIYLELNFNLSQYLQSRDRIHRLGIPDGTETNYYMLFSKYELPSIENRIYDVLKFKEELMLSSIDSGNLLSSFDLDEYDIEKIVRIER